MTLPVPITEVTSCSRIEDMCICCLPTEHEGEHLCSCGGSWTYNEENRMVPHMYPGGLTEEQATQAMNRIIIGMFAWPGDDDYDD